MSVREISKIFALSLALFLVAVFFLVSTPPMEKLHGYEAGACVVGSILTGLIGVAVVISGGVIISRIDEGEGFGCRKCEQLYAENEELRNALVTLKS